MLITLRGFPARRNKQKTSVKANTVCLMNARLNQCQFA